MVKKMRLDVEREPVATYMTNSKPPPKRSLVQLLGASIFGTVLNLFLPFILAGVVALVALVICLVAGMALPGAAGLAFVAGGFGFIVGRGVVGVSESLGDQDDCAKVRFRCPFCDRSVRDEDIRQCLQCRADWSDPDELRSLDGGAFVPPAGRETAHLSGRAPGVKRKRDGTLPPSGTGQWG